jgi:hypothetical protein
MQVSRLLRRAAARLHDLTDPDLGGGRDTGDFLSAGGQQGQLA